MADFLSYIPVVVEPHFDNKKLSSATGFFVKSLEEKYYLITNWHVVTGKHAVTKRLLSPKTGAVPDSLTIVYHAGNNPYEKKNRFSWLGITTPLIDDNKPLWIEHPLKNAVDVIALPIDNPIFARNIMYFDVPGVDDEISLLPTDPVGIIGYPYGNGQLGKYGFPLWKTGHVASDLELISNFYYVDATTKEGMSGSPVVAKRYPPKKTEHGLIYDDSTKFLGIYSGRLHRSIDIGKVWKPKVIHEIIEQKIT